jgi:hypothetical protein
MTADRGHLRAMRLLPFAAAAWGVHLMAWDGRITAWTVGKQLLRDV